MKRFAFYARYGLVGLLGGIIQTLSLYVWVDVLDLRETYLYGVVIGFCLALATTFVLQKWWTFRDHTSHRTVRQFLVYAMIALASVFLNSSLLHLSKSYFDASGVDFFGGWYLLSEAFIVAFVAILSFLANSIFNFERERGDTKVLVFGASGLVGTELTQLLKKMKISVLAPSHADVDISDEPAVENFIKRVRPTHIVNLAARINVNEIENDPTAAQRLNTNAAAHIVDCIARAHLSSSYIFLSTSYVFPESDVPCEEDSPTKPENAYGATKAQAENLIVDRANATGVRYCIIRTSWIYGPARPTFVDDVAKSLLEGRGYIAAEDQRGNLISARDLSATLVACIEKGFQSGIYHRFNTDGMRGLSRFEIAREIAHFLRIPEDVVKPGRKSEIFRGGKRPSIILKNTKLPPLRDWRAALHEYLEERYGRART